MASFAYRCWYNKHDGCNQGELHYHYHRFVVEEVMDRFIKGKILTYKVKFYPAYGYETSFGEVTYLSCPDQKAVECLEAYDVTLPLSAKWLKDKELTLKVISRFL